MSETKVIPILTGTAQVFLLVKDGCLGLVDSGNRQGIGRIEKAIKSRGLNIKNLRFVFLTHTHFDHTANAAALKQMSDTKIIAHESEAEFLRNGFHPIPNGTSPLYKFIVWMGRKFTTQQFAAFEAVEPDILFTNEMDLSPYGFDARIINTPGHTTGSSSLILGKRAFVGDAAFNLFGIKYPFFANDEGQMMKSWQLLIDLDLDYYYPAHGKRITKLELEKALQKHTRK